MKLGEERLTLEDVESFLEGRLKVSFSRKARERVIECRRFVESKLQGDKSYYGINTGFGILASKRIPQSRLINLQKNLVLSHACGVGEALPEDVVRLMMLLRANVLALGYSGVRPELIELIIGMLNARITPFVPSQGSVGASGDLAPLAHLALAMMGNGNVFYKGRLKDARTALKSAGLKPLRLMAKEGLALVNGTQMMTSVAAIALIRGFRTLAHADIAGALSLEGLRGSLTPFDERIHALRPHPGQVETARVFRRLLKGSAIISSHKNCPRVQDPYSLRCIPQVHGAVRDALEFAKGVIEREMNSLTDNPLVFSKDGDILSGGNFHGEHVAIAMDLLAIALTELGNMSERRIEQMTNPKSGELPLKFLVRDAGFNCGFMVPHIVASSLASENKVFSHPASVDTIPTSGGQEDHVSMGAWAARKVLSVLDNVEKILAIELMAAAQAIDLHEEKRPPARLTKRVYSLIRECVPFLERDRCMYADIDKIISLLKERRILKEVGYEVLLGEKGL